MTLRITGGQWRNRIIPVPLGFTSRPTTDKVRQALFNILAHASWAQDFPLQDAVVIDGFAGTGAVGLDALSRGAKHCLFLDAHKACVTHIQQLAQKWEIADQVTARFVDLAKTLPIYPLVEKPNLVFLDPPYEVAADLMPQVFHNLSAAQWLADHTLVVIEQASKTNFTIDAPWTILDQRHYGLTQLVFLTSRPAMG